jgi:hypothetical protein
MTINEIQDSLEVPYAFNEDAVIKDFKKNFPLDEIESLLPNQISTTKVSELKSDSRVKESIDRKANILANDNKAMAWYGANFLDKFEANSRGFTDEEKKKAQDYFATTLQQSYNREVDLKIKEKTGRGGAAADVIQPSTTQLISPISLQQQGAPKIEGFRMNFTQGSKLNTKAGEATILGVFYDEKNDKLYSIRSEGASASTGVSGKDARGGTSVGAAKTPYLSEDLNEGQTDISSLITGLKLNNRDELINVIRQNYNQPQTQQTKDETPEQRANRLKKELGLK